MARIAGFDIPDHKKLEYSLQAIYGIGPKTAAEILSATKLDPNKRTRDLTGDDINKIQRELEKFPVGGNLRQLVRDNIERLKRVRSYRGMRHAAELPSRGQRTRTNARTKRGKRRTIGALSKEAAAKLEQSK